MTAESIATNFGPDANYQHTCDRIERVGRLTSLKQQDEVLRLMQEFASYDRKQIDVYKNRKGPSKKIPGRIVEAQELLQKSVAKYVKNISKHEGNHHLLSYQRSETEEGKKQAFDGFLAFAQAYVAFTDQIPESYAKARKAVKPFTTEYARVHGELAMDASFAELQGKYTGVDDQETATEARSKANDLYNEVKKEAKELQNKFSLDKWGEYRSTFIRGSTIPFVDSMFALLDVFGGSELAMVAATKEYAAAHVKSLEQSLGVKAVPPEHQPIFEEAQLLQEKIGQSLEIITTVKANSAYVTALQTGEAQVAEASTFVKEHTGKGLDTALEALEDIVTHYQHVHKEKVQELDTRTNETARKIRTMNTAQVLDSQDNPQATAKSYLGMLTAIKHVRSEMGMKSINYIPEEIGKLQAYISGEGRRSTGVKAEHHVNTPAYIKAVVPDVVEQVAEPVYEPVKAVEVPVIQAEPVKKQPGRKRTRDKTQPSTKPKPKPGSPLAENMVSWL